MEWFESLEHLLVKVVTLTKFALEAISVLCIILGLLKVLQMTLSMNRRQRERVFPFNQIRLQFGMWLALALEFQLGADILGTTVSPTREDLVRLGLIAIIRTFLNFFLSKEIEAEMALERERQAHDKGLAHGDRPS
ncbi:MAG: DUF1622 domain-containing protein [Nodosilinea sp.]